MKKVKIQLKYCYGIKKLEYEFDFTNKNGCIIYSSNGTMKTSFAKSLILNDELPTLTYIYKEDEDNQKEVIKKELIDVLSMGERRALYLLEIIFEIQARKREGREILLIVDDLADSFDYKNKYAIIEYLKDILEMDVFKIIILTHNFDFYRTVGNRLGLSYDYSFMTIKTINEIKIVKGQYLKNVFESWKNRLGNDNKILIASIPFVRNIIEYIEEKNSDKYLKLTSLLHFKKETNILTLGNLEEIYNEVWKVSKRFNDKDKKVLKLIFEEADKVLKETEECVNLENKIVLSIAIRLMAEKYIINKINFDIMTNEIESDQTFELFKRFKEKFPEDIISMKLLEDVNLMTPENIHLNSFMYEPILDLSDDYLKKLYKDIKKLEAV